jgi:hypothetical protein
MVLPEGPPPGEALFAPGSDLLVRAPPAVPAALRPHDADGVVSRAPGGLGRVVEFETELFSGKMLVG